MPVLWDRGLHEASRAGVASPLCPILPLKAPRGSGHPLPAFPHLLPSRSQVRSLDSVAGGTDRFQEHQAKPRAHARVSFDARPWQPAHPQNPVSPTLHTVGTLQKVPGGTHFCLHGHLPVSTPLLGINQSTLTHCHSPSEDMPQDPRLSKLSFSTHRGAPELPRV